MRVAGVDGYKGGWIAVVIDSGNFNDAQVLWNESLESLIQSGGVKTAVVDVPIGLSSKPEGRNVEAAVRKLLVGKSSSVFNSPCRQALAEQTYAEASEMNYSVSGKKLSKQSWSIFPKIVEADILARKLGQHVIREGHPEVSFAVLNGAPIFAGKKTSAGLFARIGHLAKLGFDLVSVSSQLPANHAAKADDLADAAILSWSALRVSKNEHQSFPIAPNRDELGLEMAILA
ncbi:DUF429 domain-containing protein [Pseudooceanicola sp.]|uniref:DUF429 domain-containing protein n=1 Tax=Pseudooceanicola sp. TaxID=1914328 RepID=UPI0035C6E36B